MQRRETTTTERRDREDRQLRELEAEASRWVKVWDRWLSWCREQGIDPREARKLDMLRYQDVIPVELGGPREHLVIIWTLYHTAYALEADRDPVGA